MAAADGGPVDEKVRVAARLLEKSKQSFMLAVELYNRPHLENKVEACSMLFANAWELLIKAHFIKMRGVQSVIYKKSGRSWSLEDCVAKLLTNDKDPVRKNIGEIINLRNASTHFLVDEYEIFYGPILQATVIAYVEKYEELHDDSITTLLPERSLILPVTGQMLDEDAVIEKYDKETAELLLKNYRRVQNEAEKDTTGKFSHFYRVEFSVLKKGKEADLSVRYDKNADTTGVVIKEVQDPNDKYPLTRDASIDSVKSRLNKLQIDIYYRGGKVDFTTFHWDNVVKAYGLKNDSRYSIDRSAPGDKNRRYTYSAQAVEFVVDGLKNDPETFLDRAKQRVQEKAQEPESDKA